MSARGSISTTGQGERRCPHNPARHDQSAFTRDILPIVAQRPSKGHAAGRIFVVILSLAGLALAYRPPATILQIATQTFTGLAVLFPTVIFGLYLRKVRPLPAILSILAGEGLMILCYFKAAPTWGFLPVVPVMALAFLVYLTIHGFLLWREGLLQLSMPQWMSDPYVYLLLGVFLLSLDFWAWGSISPRWAGIPVWIGYFVGLSLLQTFLMIRMIDAGSGRRGPDRFSMASSRGLRKPGQEAALMATPSRENDSCRPGKPLLD